MKKLVIIIAIGVVLSLGLSSGALCAHGGGHGGGGHGGGGFHGGFGGGFHGGGFRGGGFRGYYGGWYGFGPWWGYPYAYPYYSYPYAYPYYSYPYAYPYASYPSDSAQLPTTSEPQQSYWYYCQDSQSYYPYVTSCPGGWTQVVPTPPQSGK